MNSNEFQQNFPPGEPVPEMLGSLLEFQNAVQSEYSGRFFLTGFRNRNVRVVRGR